MNIRYSLLIALMLMAAGTLLLHLRIHPLYLPMYPDNINHAHLAAFAFPLFDLIIISALYLSPKTAAFGYLLNGIFAIFATILMGHLSIYELLLNNPPFLKWIFTSTLPDILIAWADFLIGYALFYVIQLTEPATPK